MSFRRLYLGFLCSCTCVVAFAAEPTPARSSDSESVLLAELARADGRTLDAQGNLIPAPLNRTVVGQKLAAGRSIAVPIGMRFVPADPATGTAAFFAGIYEVTQAEYSAFLAANPSVATPLGWSGRQCSGETANFPVTGISQADALAYCKWVSEHTRHHVGLPTLVQLEILRKGTASVALLGKEIHAVGGERRDVNRWGCYDVVSNAREMAADSDSPCVDPSVGFRTAISQTTAAAAVAQPTAELPPSFVEANTLAANDPGPTPYYGAYFTEHPASQAVAAGATVTLSCRATSFFESGVKYQWYFNDTLIPGATDRTYTLANIKAEQVGVYYVEAILTDTRVPSLKSQNSEVEPPTTSTLTQAEAVISNPAIIAIGLSGTPPTITRQPGAMTTVFRGETGLVSVAFAGTPPFAARWKISQSTVETFWPLNDLRDFQFTSTTTSATASYRNPAPGKITQLEVTIFGAYGTVTSAAAKIMVITEGTAPRISAQPQSQSVLRGANVLLQVAVEGAPTPSLQWFRNGSPIPDATGDSLTLNNVQDADFGTYTVTATNSLGSVASSPVSVNLSSPPSTSGGGSGGGGGGGGAPGIWFGIATVTALLARRRRQ